jgi:3-dehydroquinate synthase
MSSISVETPSRSYTVEYGRGELRRVGALLSALGTPTGVSIVSAPRVWRACGRAVSRGLARDGGRTKPLLALLPDGERAKTLGCFEQLCRTLARGHLDRGGLLLAVGGGTVGDVAGFAAATYLRGIRLVHVPTTLVAQVDSAIGGKTGVNLPEGKNLVGAFYQPALVIADPALLATLPPREYRSGIHEVIKYAVLGDRHLFEFLENRMAAVVRQERAALDWVIPRCIALKAQIVGRDERDTGVREALNLGHTFGHALESLTSYRRYLHGEAVGWGLVAAARLAVAIGWLPGGDAQRIEALVDRAGPLPPLVRFAPARWIAAMLSDKKSRGGRLRFLLPHEIGAVRAAENVPSSALAAVLSGLGHDR